jgi:plasmid stability protein
MPSLSLRGIPQDIYDGLKTLAARNHRSMQEQARLLIEREVRLAQPAAMERARGWRERMRSRPMPFLLEDLRADRDR